MKKSEMVKKIHAYISKNPDLYYLEDVEKLLKFIQKEGMRPPNRCKGDDFYEWDKE